MSKPKRTCRRCGCSYSTPCITKSGMSCMWVDKDLCSHCLTPTERNLSILAEDLGFLAKSLAQIAASLKRDVQTVCSTRDKARK